MLFKALLVDADPGAQWLNPLLSGDPQKADRTEPEPDPEPEDEPAPEPHG